MKCRTTETFLVSQRDHHRCKKCHNLLMKRPQIIAACLLRSLSKRLWLVTVPAVALGVIAYMVLGSTALCLLTFLVVALSVSTSILWSSYNRHLHEFPTTGFDALNPPLITED